MDICKITVWTRIKVQRYYVDDDIILVVISLLIFLFLSFTHLFFFTQDEQSDRRILQETPDNPTTSDRNPKISDRIRSESCRNPWDRIPTGSCRMSDPTISDGQIRRDPLGILQLNQLLISSRIDGLFLKLLFLIRYIIISTNTYCSISMCQLT